MVTTKTTVETKVMHSTVSKIDTPIALPSAFNTLFKSISDRETEILSMRFGLKNFDKHTLEAIGQKFGITRERVRQIENASIKKLAVSSASTDLVQILGFAQYLLESNGGVLEKHRLLRGILNEMNSGSEADMHYIELTLMMSANVVTVHNTIKFHPYFYMKEVGMTAVADVTSFITKQLKKKKDVIDFETLQSGLASETSYKFSPLTLTNICRISKELKVVDQNAVGLFKWSHINPRNIHDKILFVMKEYGKPMHFEELTESIRNHGFDDKAVNVQAVHNELIRHDDFVLIGRGIYALAEWGYKPGTVADVITEILKDGPLSREEIVATVLEVRQVKKITIQLNLKNKALFERVGRGTYALKK